MKYFLTKHKTKIFFSVLIFFVVITGMIGMRRAQKGSNDFDTFYNAGRAVLTGEGIYYTGEYYQKDNEVSPFLYPPFAACFFSLFAWMPLSLAAFFWNTLNIFLFWICLKLILGLLKISLSDFGMEYLKKNWVYCSMLAVIIFAIFLDNITMAQVNIFVLTLVLAALFFTQRKNEGIAGFLLAGAVFIKVTPVLFCIYFFMKRKWRALAGFSLGVLFLAFLIPTMIWGFNNNRVYHRQFLGRTLKPIAVEIMAHFREEKIHPLKKTASMIAHDRLTGRLTEKNQALPAVLTRLFLKDRQAYGYAAEPIYAVRRYERLPVFFGGISAPVLDAVLAVLTIFILCMLVWVFRPRKTVSDAAVNPDVLEWSLCFLTMTLLAPWARSHQFVFWLLPVMVFLLKKDFFKYSRLAKFIVLGGTVFYFLQALPYGKAIGFGAFANTALWISIFLLRRNMYGKAVKVEPV